MNFLIEGVGEFPATSHEAALLEYYANLLPQRSPNGLLQILYLCRCLELTTQSQTRRSTGPHVSAHELLAVAPMAALNIFGEDAAKWLRALDLVSSAEFGRVVYELATDGILAVRDENRVEDFRIHSPLDEFLK